MRFVVHFPVAILLLAFQTVILAGTKTIVELKADYKRPAKIPYPAENPYSKAKDELGKTLFFDPRVSGSQVMSCGTCHNPSFSWGDQLNKGIGNNHKELGRRSPTILNLAWGTRMFWDGRAANLEDQATGPIESEGEMNMKIDGPNGLLARMSILPKYGEMFDKAFPESKGHAINKENIGKAIATYERGIVSGTASFDKFISGDEKAISNSAKNGFLVFNTKGNCSSCHSGWAFTDHSFQDIGIADEDIGRAKILPKLASMQHAFKTPTLRNVDQRGPYMHNGSERTLADVVEFYNRGGDKRRENTSTFVKELHLTEIEKADLVAFLKTLTSVDAPQSLPILPVAAR